MPGDSNFALPSEGLPSDLMNWKLDDGYEQKLDISPKGFFATQNGFVIAGSGAGDRVGTLYVRGFNLQGQQEWEQKLDGIWWGMTAKGNAIVLLVKVGALFGEEYDLVFLSSVDGSIQKKRKLEAEDGLGYTKYMQIAPDGIFYLQKYKRERHIPILVKYSPDGNLMGEYPFPDETERSISAISFGPNGVMNVLGGSGKYSDTLMLAQMDQQGKIQWIKHYVDARVGRCKSVFTDANGFVYAIGDHSKTNKIAFVKFGEDGTLLDLKTLGNTDKLHRGEYIEGTSLANLVVFGKGITGSSNNDPMDGYLADVSTEGKINFETYTQFGKISFFAGLIALDSYDYLIAYEGDNKSKMPGRISRVKLK